MTRAGQSAAVVGSPGTTGSTGHGDVAVIVGARPDGRAPRPSRTFPVAAPALVRRP